MRTEATTGLPGGYKITELGPLPKEWEVVRLEISAEEDRKRTLEALFKTLLHHMMTGKLRVEVYAGG